MNLRTAAALSATLLLATPAVFAGQTLDRITQSKQLVGVLMENYPPFSFLNEQNQLDGFDVDVTKAVADKLGVKLKLETPSWEVIAAGRWNGRYDVCICSMTPSAASISWYRWIPLPNGSDSTQAMTHSPGSNWASRCTAAIMSASCR